MHFLIIFLVTQTKALKNKWWRVWDCFWRIDEDNDEKRENEDGEFDEMSHEEDGRDTQEWKEIIDEEDETSESLSLNLVDKKTEFCFRSLDKKKIQVTMHISSPWDGTREIVIKVKNTAPKITLSTLMILVIAI